MIMSHTKGTGSIDVHSYWPYETPVPKYWCPVHGRIRESIAKRENGIARCRLCNTLLLDYPTIFKPSKPETVEIDVRPVILGQTPRSKNHERTTQGPGYTHKPSSSNEKTSLDEDSVLLNLIKIIVYLFVDLFLLALLFRLLT